MGRAPCCDKENVKKGPWSPEEDLKLKDFIEKNGTGGNWIALPQKAGLKRCGKSCRLRWLNYLRPNIKHGDFTEEEDRIICGIFASIGSRWSVIAAHLPGRTDNDIKNYWNTKLKKKLMGFLASNQTRPSNSFQTPFQTQSSSEFPSQSSSSQLYSSPVIFTGLEDISFLQNNRLNNTISLSANYSSLQGKESLVMKPMQYYPVKDYRFLMCGGGEVAAPASCSSSDGSCSLVSYVKEVKQEGMGGSLQSYMSNDHQFEENQMDNGGNDHHDLITWSIDQKPNEQFENNMMLQYNLEEVNNMQGVTNVRTENSFFLLNDEKKAQEKAMMMMYYYSSY